MTREVPISRGLVALVDDADYDAAALAAFGEYARLNFPAEVSV